MSTGTNTTFGRDNWRITPKLTLNLGLHYEINTPFAETHDYWVNLILRLRLLKLRDRMACRRRQTGMQTTGRLAHV